MTNPVLLTLNPIGFSVIIKKFIKTIKLPLARYQKSPTLFLPTKLA